MGYASSVGSLRGMPAELAARLKEYNLTGTRQFLEAGCSPEDRKKLAEKLGADPEVLLEMLNRADLDRINGIGVAYSNLLEEAGVDTVRELARRVPEHLYAKIMEINAEKKITTRPPTLTMIEAWVAEAKLLPVILTY